MSGLVIGAALEVHRCLGPGLVEGVYARCLAHEFDQRGVGYQREVVAPITFKGLRIDSGLRLDFLVEDEVVVELKAVQTLDELHIAQLLTYLRCTGKPLGLLINFNTPLLRNGIRRIASTP